MGDGKLVRDRIPDIFRAEGLDPVIRMAGEEEYAVRLRDKLCCTRSPARLASTRSKWSSCEPRRQPRPVALPTASSGQETDNPAASDGTPPVALSTAIVCEISSSHTNSVSAH